MVCRLLLLKKSGKIGKLSINIEGNIGKVVGAFYNEVIKEERAKPDVSYNSQKIQ